jgi:hypothetical protein
MAAKAIARLRTGMDIVARARGGNELGIMHGPW